MKTFHCLECVADDAKMLEVARKAVEDALVELRDSRIAILRNNGLVIKESDGTDSYVIRLGMEDAMAIGLRAISKCIEKDDEGRS